MIHDVYQVEHAVKVLKMHPDANSEHSGSGGAASYGWEFKKNEN